MFLYKPTSLNPRLSNLLSILQVEHHISLKRVTSKLNNNPKKIEGCHVLSKEELTPRGWLPPVDEIGLGRNWFFTYSTFTFKQCKIQR